MLCHSCEEARFPSTKLAAATKISDGTGVNHQARTVYEPPMADTQIVIATPITNMTTGSLPGIPTSTTSGSTTPTVFIGPPLTATTLTYAPTTTSTATPSVSGVQASTPQTSDATHAQDGGQPRRTIIDELLTYVTFYRDRCTHAELHSIIAHFYSPIEISTSKTKVMKEFVVHLSGCQYITTRRQTSIRTAHDAEIDDIMGMLDLLDNSNVLSAIQFVAVSLDRLPKYGPNEINVCTVVDRQIHIDAELSELKQALHNTTAEGYIEQFAATSDKMIDAVHTRLTSATDTINGQLQQLAAICRNIQTMSSSATHNSSQRAVTSAPIDDRVANIIVFGLSEDRNSSVWNSVLLKAFQHVAGRPVEIADAFRIGKFNANQTRPRPIIVKLRNVWDKRLLLSNARKLADITEFRRIGFAPDEPLETRRKNTMKRLQFKASNAGKQVFTSDDGDCLYVDGDLVFSLKDGFIRNADVSNSNNGIHG